jgi:RNA polymerase subunit RPABC4/transcription elongation factor Spt4
VALIKCSECNKVISDKAVSCPDCGFPLSLLADIQVPPKKCPECDAIINDLDEVCGECGFPLTRSLKENTAVLKVGRDSKNRLHKVVLEKTKKCSNCNAINNYSHCFCDMCGLKFDSSFSSNNEMKQRVYSTCPKCNTQYFEPIKFCGKCGSDISVTMPTEDYG